jgi:uncharacterized protein (DUF302 family)
LSNSPSNPTAGLDCPIRVLVYRDEKNDVWVLHRHPTAGLDCPIRVLVYRDEKNDVWVLHRREITDRDEAFKKASDVFASIRSTVE